MRRLLALLVASLLVALDGTALFAWGPEGHRLVARLAWERMSPASRAEATRLLDGVDFAESANWADDVKTRDRPETSAWHFVNIPYGRATYDAARDCRPSPRGDCIVAALRRETRTLADRSAGSAARREALEFVIHLVGDLHQPLHAIDNRDAGGNDVRVRLEGGPNPASGWRSLHAVWDSTLLAEQGRGEAAALALLDSQIARSPLAPGPIDFVRWAEESHAVAVADAYDFPGFSAGGPPARVVTLDRAYQRQALMTIDRQLELAGVRLAAVLNDAIGASGRR